MDEESARHSTPAGEQPRPSNSPSVPTATSSTATNAHIPQHDATIPKPQGGIVSPRVESSAGSDDDSRPNEDARLPPNCDASNSSPLSTSDQGHNQTENDVLVVDDAEADAEVALRVKWGSSLYAVELPPQSTVGDLKRRLFELTDVLPKRQKVLGLSGPGGRLPDNSLPLMTFNLKPDQRVMLVGSREADISAVNNNYFTTTAVVNDFDIDYDADDTSSRVLRDPVSVYRRRLERRIETTEIRIMNEPRDNKHCLVLDLDNTLLDCRGSGRSIAELGRPGLHQFLAAVYRYYDIVIWSQTSWRWLETKLTGLSMLFSDDYKVSFVLDRTSMFSVTSRKHGQERTHEVKALEIIWRKFPNRWSACNTIHVDDLSRNFALNPRSGLKIAPFKFDTPADRSRDVELFALQHYLTFIAQNETDFTTLNHKHWKRYTARLTQREQNPNGDDNSTPPH